jgi:NAD(P)-dependent dehydrogenase (short-subunit alcohol dehydrogenase family)
VVPETQLVYLEPILTINTGSRGLGLHTATAFLLAGAKKVILVSRKAEGMLKSEPIYTHPYDWSSGKQGLNQAVERLNSLPGVCGTAVSFAADLSKTEEIQKLVSYLKRSGEKLDILIANAAATWGGPFEPTPVASTIKVLNLNVQSIFTLIQS